MRPSLTVTNLHRRRAGSSTSNSTTPALEQSQISNVSSWLTPQLAREILLEREASAGEVEP